MNPGTYLVAYHMPKGPGYFYMQLKINNVKLPFMNPHPIFSDVLQLLQKQESLTYPTTPENQPENVYHNLVMFAFHPIRPPSVQMPLTTIRTKSAEGTPGQMRWGVDAGVAYVYVCVAVNEWQRATLAKW